MRVYAKTDIGKAREMNQDFYYVSQVNENMTLCILADGMGGYNGGEIASSLATNSSKEYIEENWVPKKALEMIGELYNISYCQAYSICSSYI